MALPEYTVRQKYTYRPSINEEEVVLEPGMFVRPIWNEDFVPRHLKEVLEQANTPKQGPWNGSEFTLIEEKHIMCVVGTRWIPIPKENIREK